MATASGDRMRIEWVWKSNSDLCSSAQSEEWSPYSDVETAMIEEAYQKKEKEALLDDYHISFKHLVQISNKNEKIQRSVKRLINEEAGTRLREARFMPNPIRTHSEDNQMRSCPMGREFLDETRKYFNLKPTDTILTMHNDTCRMLMKKAAEGIIIEGKKIGKQKEAEWLVGQLSYYGDPQYVGRTCAHLYCCESFLYKMLNEVMRGNGWMSNVPTLGPFAILLDNAAWYRSQNMGPITVYRGATLTDDVIEQYTNLKYLHFSSFTSTSLSRELAEQFGNVLFIIDNVPTGHGGLGWHVMEYSPYPNEQEILIYPGFAFEVKGSTFEKSKNKWIIHLRGCQ